MTEQSQYNHMLMFALGPVQPFIMQARKTRDLWIGSLVLSKLMEAAMSGIKGQFVFPAIQTVKDIPDIPNKYVALFSSLEQAQQAAQQSKEQIKERWVAMCQTVWEKVIAIYSDQATQIIWQRQTNFDHLFEIYWAIVERQEGKNYSAWLDETESLFAARKRLRDFRPQNEPGEKSAISGEREVLRGIRTDREGLRLFWQKIARKHSSSDINQQGDERLDAIDMIKRFAIQVHAIAGKGAFPSTSSIATGSFVEKLLDSDPQREAWRQWREVTAGKLASKSQDAAQDIPYLAQKASKEWQWILQRDGDLYFPAVFAPHRPEKDYDLPDSTSTIKRGKAALAALLDEADTLNITRPTPYYAIMQMDGDNMGLLLGSTRAAADHEAISAALSDFARGIAPDLVERQYPARLVYAGGDDVLAFAPLARDVTSTNRDQPLSILALADELQARYQDRVKKALSLVPPPQDGEQGQTVTASMGIAIAHHYTSLSYVLRSAREEEHAAKERYGRNALVVSILRRSGEQTQVG
ncbi:MAG: type III-B CRISPR-associated protein Cas10/Cmr2, partial [Ktedonobacteraceae bacterium]|nr:type III-B CRISPR-associated protein Cas10/Cmr2 [Ktedonobacteraceae bacterium]